MTIYHTVHMLHTWHRSRLSFYEKGFIDSMKEAVGGVGSNPTDLEVIEGNGLSKKQVLLIKKLGKRFLLK